MAPDLAERYPPTVAVPCPACGAALVEGVLRCRACGADARAARPGGVAATIAAGDAAPDAWRAAELLDELGELSPPVLEAWRQADQPKKRRLVAILAELQGIVEKVWAKH